VDFELAIPICAVYNAASAAIKRGFQE